MVKIEAKLLVFLFVFFMSTYMVSATYNIQNYSIDKFYTGGELIRGKINMSFNKQPSNTLFTSNLDGNITLIDLILNSSYAVGEDFNCSISNCLKSYSIDSQPITSLEINADSTKIVGFKITGKDIVLSDVKLNVKSDAAPSCSKQADFDVLNNNENIFQNYKFTNETCDVEKSYGCYNTGLVSSKYKVAEITGEKYCNKISIEGAPAYWIGANVINSTTINDTLTMTLYSLDGDYFGSCDLPAITNSKQKTECLIEHSNIKPSEMFVCISEKNGNSNSNYKISTESTGDVCGTSELNSDQFDGDYDIFISVAKYDYLDLEINYTNFAKYQDVDLISYIEDYINDNYDGDCSSDEGCIIPIGINSNINQKLTFTNFEVKYKSGATFSNNELYLLKEKIPTITSDFINLDLSKAGFKLPSSTNLVRFELYLDGSKKVSSLINVSKGFEFSLLENNFTVGLESDLVVITSEKIYSINWEFGDGTTSVDTTNNFVKHRYIQEGVYTLKVTLTRQDGSYSVKTFNVLVGDSKVAVEKLIIEKESKLNNLTKQINSYEPWIRSSLEKSLNLDLNNTIQAIKIKLNQASDSEQYSTLITELVSYELPDSIYESQKGTLPFVIGFNGMDASYIDPNNNGNSWDSNKINDAKLRLTDWNLKNYNSEIDYKNIDKKTGESSDTLLSYYKLKINKKSNSEFLGQAYLFINYPKENIVFKEEYNAKEISNGASTATVIDVSEADYIEFVVPSKIAPNELAIYIFPSDIEKELGIGGEVTPPVPPKRPYWTYILLIIAFFAVYIFLQEWYKKRYENYLFPNRDDLFNMINFINNSKISGMENEKIINNLLKMKWKKEQINYAIKKLEGRRTGMWEIPIFKIFENIKVKKEIERRQNNQNPDLNFGA